MKSRVPKTHHCRRRRCLWASNPWPWGCRCGSSRSEAPPAGGRRRHPGPSAYYPSRPAGSRASAGQAHLGPCWRSYSTWQRGQGGGKGSAPTGSGWTAQVVAFLVRQGTCLRWWLIYCSFLSSVSYLAVVQNSAGSVLCFTKWVLSLNNYLSVTHWWYLTMFKHSTIRNHLWQNLIRHKRNRYIILFH